MILFMVSTCWNLFWLGKYKYNERDRRKWEKKNTELRKGLTEMKVNSEQ